MATLTATQIAHLTEEFTQFKLTAKGPEALRDWFKEHPYLIPKLAEEYFDCVTINVSRRSGRFDFDLDTKFEDYNFEFYIQTVRSETKVDALKSITGFDFSSDINKDTFFLSSYTDTLDALEWRFIAVDSLTNIAESEVQSLRRVSVFKKLLDTHFPHLTWETYLGLYRADLLPHDKDSMWSFLHGSSLDACKISVPNDLQP